MKKITLLFAAILAISEMSFGQKEGKILWERTVKSVATMSPIYQLGGVSSNGNSLVYYNFNNPNTGLPEDDFKVYDKNGLELWKLSDVYKNSARLSTYKKINDKIALISCAVRGKEVDSVFYLDSNYLLIRGFDTFTKNTYLKEVKDGIIYNDANNLIIKYDLNGNVEWKYQNDSQSFLLPQTLKDNQSINRYYLLLPTKNNEPKKRILILDKKGSQIALTEPFVAPSTLGFESFPTTDKGTWISMDNGNKQEVTRLDSTGKLTAQIATPEKVRLLASDNAIIYSSSDDSTTTITRIDTKGNVKKILVNGKSLGMTLKDMNSVLIYTSKRKNIDNYQAFLSLKSFDNSNTDFEKSIPSYSGTRFSPEYSSNVESLGDYTFISQNNTPTMVVSAIQYLSYGTIYATNFQYYNTDGTLKFEKNFDEADRISRHEDNSRSVILRGDYIYYYKKNGELIKVRFSDGKEIWKIKREPILIKISAKGSTLMLYKECSNNTSGCIYKIESTQADGTINWNYTLPKMSSALDGYISFDVADDEESVTAYGIEYATDGSGNLNYILRKIATTCYNTAEIRTKDNLSVCSGEKVTLNATEQPRITYEWLRDSKAFTDDNKKLSQSFGIGGTYQVRVTDPLCQISTLSNELKITIKPSPEATISTDIKGVIYEPFTVKMTASSGTNLTYQWLKDEVIIDNATTNIYEAKKSGKYKVSVTKDGCLKTSEALTISIQIPLANEGEIGEESIQIYPNPNQGKFKIVLPKTLQNADIQLFDVLGRERKLIHTGEQAQADGLVQGVYFLRVNKGEKSVVNKIVIE